MTRRRAGNPLTGASRVRNAGNSGQSPNEGSRVPAKRALNSAVARGGTRPRPAVPRLSCICYSTQLPG